MSGQGISRLASRKLVAAIASIAVIALNRKFSIGLTDDDIKSVVDIAAMAIGGQGLLDLISQIRPILVEWRTGEAIASKGADNA